ncbi:carbonic anhydrase 14 isoform X3 [Fukomys damarensis]|uniref:carbonic anhydrase 14 isoform X3 n=1 Tax=Fukomys damarensis TaxID=885580 RepID=UPI00053F8985|nr:carbonic anhydrase 14 isoform X3 [Fukomys damarensis]
MLFFALLLEVTGILAADGGHHWTYEGPHGQDHWPDSYPECGSSAQSPIDIQTDCVTFDPELPALRLHGYEQPGVEPLDLHNNGHTVQLSLPPTLELGGLPRKYVAAQLHLHWGQKGSPGGSEHQINSEATAAEVPGHKELRPGHKDNTGVAGAGQRKSRTLLSHPGVIRPSFGRQLQRAGVTMVLGSRPWWGEETLNASTPPAFPQLHIVHYDSDSYSSLNEAAHRPLGLAVLGVLIEVSDLQSFPARSTSSALPGPISWPASSQDGWAAATHPVHEYLTPFILSRSDNLRASLQCERAAPPTAGAVLPLQRLAHHAPLLPERALDSLQPQGPDFSGPAGKASADTVLHRRGALGGPGAELPSPPASQSADCRCFFCPRSAAGCSQLGRTLKPR